MVASVLNTPRAIEVSVFVVRAFVKLREMLGAHRDLTGKLTELENRVEAHDQNAGPERYGLSLPISRVGADVPKACSFTCPFTA